LATDSVRLETLAERVVGDGFAGGGLLTGGGLLSGGGFDGTTGLDAAGATAEFEGFPPPQPPTSIALEVTHSNTRIKRVRAAFFILRVPVCFTVFVYGIVTTNLIDEHDGARLRFFCSWFNGTGDRIPDVAGDIRERMASLGGIVDIDEY
jgi:hypothetical protein